MTDGRRMFLYEKTDKSQQQHHLETVSNKLLGLGRLNRIYARATLRSMLFCGS